MNRIYHINQYLLEKYPSIWNTRILWMLLISIAVHILFFFIGFVSHINPTSLHRTRAIDDYFSTGLVFVHVIISVLMIVGWLVFMFKNNAFKSFYPKTGRKLFFDFVQYFIIILVSTTFYFSYMSGFRLFINSKYDDEKMEKNIATINNAAAFLSQDLENYTLDNRVYPNEFSDYYCETEINKIHRDQKYFVYYNRVYQYFSLYEKIVTDKDKNGEFIYPAEELKNKTELAYFETSPNFKTRTYFFKKNVEDLSPFIKTTAPSYSNYSAVFYSKENRDSNYTKTTFPDNNKSFLTQRRLINQKTIEILERKNSKELQDLLQSFIDISNDFAIKNNLDAKSWADLVHQNGNAEVKSFIKKYKPLKGKDYDPNKAPDGYYDYAERADVVIDSATASNNYLDEYGNVVVDTVDITKFNPNLHLEVSPKDFFKKNISDKYYYTTDLQNLLENVDDIKTNNYFSDAIQFFIWIAFSLAAFIFSFRVTNLRSLLFSIVTGGVLVLLITLFCVVFAYGFNVKSQMFIYYTIFTVGCLILLLPFLTIKKLPKIVPSIFMIISINGIHLFLFLILIIITEHQTWECKQRMYTTAEEVSCYGILDYLGGLTTYLLLIASFVFIYFYTSFIKKWKALAE